MGPEMICEGCGRHWSDPIPANCPECGEVFWVMGAYGDHTGSTKITTAWLEPYYCGQCNSCHKAVSGIGLRHRRE